MVGLQTIAGLGLLELLLVTASPVAQFGGGGICIKSVDYEVESQEATTGPPVLGSKKCKGTQGSLSPGIKQ